MTESVDTIALESAVDATCMMLDRLVVFTMAGQSYGIPIERVQEIQQIVAFSEVPSGDSGVLGMMDLRGQVIPAVDLAHLVGVEALPHTLVTPMIVCRADGRLLAFVVDAVEDVLGVPAGCVQEPPAMHELSRKLLGVARLDQRLVYVLDVDRVIERVEIEGDDDA